METLIIEHDGRTTRHDLDSDRCLIGRDSDADIRLEGNGVSREHCLVRKIGTHRVLTDLVSNNGTMVNGRRVLQAELICGDVIVVGEFRIRFEIEGQRPDASRLNDLSRFIFAADKPKAARMANDWDIAIESGGITSRAKLAKSELLIGSGPHCDLVLAGREVSFNHVLVVKDGMGIKVINVSKRKPVMIKEKELPRKTVFMKHFTLTIGPHRVTFSR